MVLTCFCPWRAEGTNCHRSCYTLDLAKALSLKKSFFTACKAKATISKPQRNKYGCASVVQYKL
jgi:hypothetical protein